MKLGKDYIKTAFETARKENPKAILCYSDLLNEVPGRRADMNHEIVRMLKEKGLIDGLMMHMRIDAVNPPEKDALVEMMKSYDIPIYITGLTVDLTKVGGSQEQKNLIQAEVYKTIMKAAIESGVTRSFVMWGIGNFPNWLEDPTIYNGNYEKKPAYYALIQTMINGLK